MTKFDESHFVLIPGLGADERIFSAQKLAFKNLITPSWQIPATNETFDQFIDRWAEQIRPYNPKLIGGASFGGIIAMEIAKRLSIQHCLLIGSAKHFRELPKRIRFWHPLRHLARPWLVSIWQLHAKAFQFFFGRFLSRSANAILRQFQKSDPHLVSWSLRNFFEFTKGDKNSKTDKNRFQFCLYQIHGQKDLVFPSRLVGEHGTKKLKILKGSGHVPSISDSKSVNNFIQEILQEITNLQKSPSQIH